MPDLGKAYVQIIPSAEGIKGKITTAIGGEATAAGKAGGLAIGRALVGAAIGAIGAAGIGKAVSASISEGAALQQSIGGIETLFKDSADTVRQYASEAYKTAGLSANQYMEQATSFSASLLQSLGGDTAAAAEAANQAIIDMSDNANKMGTDIGSIQNAYQGFAKQNYAMLDNLKLGYGGTKEEMQRLLDDASKLSGIKYDMSSLDDVYEAIHVVQEEMGITGTTSKEAAQTFSGSMAAMKAAAQNFLGNLALGEDITANLSQLMETTRTFLLDNLFPMIGNIISAVPQIVATGFPLLVQLGGDILQQVLGGIIQGAPSVLTSAAQSLDMFLQGVTAKLPEVLNEGVDIITNLANGVLNNLPAIISAIGSIMSTLITFILNNLPTILQAGVRLIGNLATGIINNLPAIVGAIARVIARMLAQLAQAAPSMLQRGISLLGSVASGIVSAIPRIISAAAQAIRNAASAFASYDWGSLGRGIIRGIVSGITGAAGSLFSSLRGLASRALSAAKSALSIHSPSRVFADEVGQWIPKGIAAGIEREDAPVVAINRSVDAMVNAAAADFGKAPAAVAGSPFNVTMNVYASPGMDVNQLADAVSNRLYRQVRMRGATA